VAVQNGPMIVCTAGNVVAIGQTSLYVTWRNKCSGRKCNYQNSDYLL